VVVLLDVVAVVRAGLNHRGASRRRLGNSHRGFL
jgi:hypothetical protein